MGWVMKSISVTVAAVLLCFSAVAAAESGTAPDPMDKAYDAVRKNSQQEPNSAGLQRAANRLFFNRRAFDERREAKSGSKVDRPDRVDRMDRIDQQAIVDLPGRSELARGRRR
jgi:hypothetical protein